MEDLDFYKKWCLAHLKFTKEYSNYSAVVRMVCYGLVSLWNFLENHLK